MKLAYSPKEVCEAIGICRTKLYQHINAGKIQARKDGRDTVILKQDLDAFLENLPPYVQRERNKV
ncbi:MAG: helix-turn-helix domain-containing protein [Alphaproteobacteria bacterium]|nr:helix-turn-helix domain-containing protein [Alphaproteobacteria bacterium]MCL2505844.1 helix-turn-helix domain-containing protein [Alphaproteobacteria bacterium]